MEPKEKWIEDTLNSLNGFRQVTASDELKLRLKSIPITVSPGIRVMVPVRSIWLAAASIALIIGINITAIYATQQQTSDSETVEADYFTYLNQL
jgi:hypothetical protein